ncbi:MAG: relaxase domain-containing protein [Actinomycetota bacterium]|nr:relaxase domain-containing protein [Actinomycetota bacterium]
MRVTTLKVGKAGLTALIDYYAGLADDQLRRDGTGRGPVDYYLDPDEPPGRWWGRGCAAMELAGEVQPEQLAALLQARHPAGGGRLGRSFGAKSARAFDATFSAPKSASLLWALSPDPWVRAEVLAAHDTAVVAALDWFEHHGAVTRRGRDGVDQVDTQGLVAALFRQHTSRSADPQLHTHAVIAAKVQDSTGKWLSLDARFLKQQQRSISWVYASALRSELTGRLGVSWGPVSDGHAEMGEVPGDLLRLFSQRSEQVEVKTAELIAAWVDEHDGAEPDAPTIYRLERWAVLDSRPDKQDAVEAETLRAEWTERARAGGFEPLSLPGGHRPLPGNVAVDVDAVITQALEALAASSSTWLRADLAREIAALLPADTSGSATEAVRFVDLLAEAAAARCVELHPAAPAGAPCRRDGRPLGEHVTDRRLTMPAVLNQEARLLAWARSAVGSIPPAGEDPPAAAVQAVSGDEQLVLVVGPAGAGKTTMLGAAAARLRSRRRPAVGLAPSGKAADVLATETGWPATTLAKLLHEHAKPEGPPAAWWMPAGTSIVLDESGMVSTEDLDALVGLVRRRRWRLVCVGDPAQLPAVGRGGMFAQWCEDLPAHHLEEVHRFTDDWQAEASLALRRGERAAARAYAARQRLQTVHPALLADRVARKHVLLTSRGQSVAITTASSGTARAINVQIQRRRNPRRQGRSVALADGTRAFVGDQVATRRNDAGLVTDRGSTIRNRQTWTVKAVGEDGSLTVADPQRGQVQLPTRYVARHLELGWAVTGYGNQGVTTDHGICVVEPSSSRAAIYVGMTRGRGHNLAWVVDRSGLADAEEAFAAAIARPANALTAHAVRAKLGGQAPEPVLEDRVQRMARRLDRLQASSPARGLSL